MKSELFRSSFLLGYLHKPLRRCSLLHTSTNMNQESTLLVLKNCSIWTWDDKTTHQQPSGHVQDVSSLVINRLTGLIDRIDFKNEDHRIEEIKSSSFGVSKDTELVSSSLQVDNTTTTTVDLKGQLILPGLIDSHIHVAMVGESKYFLDLSTCFSIQELQVMVRQHVSRHPDLHWIQGVNWDQTKLGRYPHFKDLDAVCPDKPLFLWRACWHIAVVNSAAMKSAHFDMTTPPTDICGGAVDTDENGYVTGIFRENALLLITKTMSQSKTDAQKRKFILEGLKMCVQSGLTSVQTNDESCYRIYNELQQADQLPCRVYLTPTIQDLDINSTLGGVRDISPFLSSSLTQSQLPTTDGSATRDTSSSVTSDGGSKAMLSVDRVKLFSDGSLGAETAAIRLLGASENRTDSSSPNPTPSPSPKKYKGLLTYESLEAIKDDILKASKRKYRVEVHAIGDAAAEQVLEAMEQVHSVVPLHRPILTHCQVLGSDLIERMARLGVIADVQPSFVPTDMRWVRDRISAQQQAHAYAWRTLAQCGVHVAGGSDAPIENHSPLLGLHDAIYRCARRLPTDAESSTDMLPNGDSVVAKAIPSGYTYNSTDVYRPEECLPFAEALYMYTVGAAYAGCSESVLGRVQVGFKADLTVVDASIITNHRRLFNAQPSLVVVDGDIKYSSSTDLYENDIVDSEDSSHNKKARVEGPFVPGKNGLVHQLGAHSSFRCACLLLGKFCVDI